jgi:hypothetical protein
MSNEIWVAIGCAIAVVIAVAALVSFRRRAFDLGSVSDQWIAHHRANQPHDP